VSPPSPWNWHSGSQQYQALRRGKLQSSSEGAQLHSSASASSVEWSGENQASAVFSSIVRGDTVRILK